jgi:signal transduction histidine kinase/CheY-like chemotaxis protein
MLKSKLFRQVFLAVCLLVLANFVAIYVFCVPLIRTIAYQQEKESARALLDSVFETANSSYHSIEAYRTSALDAHKRELKDIVLIGEAYLRSQLAKAKAGALTQDEARREAFEALRTFRYGNNDYLWVSDYHSFLLSHPDPKLYNADYSRVRDIKGTLIVPSAVDVAVRNGEGFTTYFWQRLGEAEPVRKMTYSRDLKEWGCVVATGVYIDDVDKEVSRRYQSMLADLRVLLSRLRIARSGYMFVFDDHQRMLLHPSKALEGKDVRNLLEPVTKKPIVDMLVRSTARPDGELRYKWDRPDDPGNYVYEKISWTRHFDGFGWYISSSVYVDELTAGAQILSNRIVLISGLALLLSVGVAFLFVSRIAHVIERKNRELEASEHRAVEASRAKSAFLATMSHEIRTPMNAIIGMTGLLLETPLEAGQREYAETIRSSGDGLLAMLNDILDFSKIEAGRMDLERQPFDLAECVDSALDLLAPQAAQKGLELTAFVAPGTPAVLVGDLTRVRQILANLLGNAVKFTDAGEIAVSVEARPLEAPPQGAAPGERWHEVSFRVRDTGVGIAEDRRDRLFLSFSQIDSSTARQYGGSGLGLAICKRLTEMMGGRIGVESEPGRGSTFHFTIVAPEGPPEAARRSLSPFPANLEGKRVLLVDDNATNLRILSLQTGSWGMVPRATSSPTEALAWLEGGEAFDVALLDRRMPEMDGIELARSIRRARPSPSLPIILLTSIGPRESDEKPLPADLCLTKPVKAALLRSALADAMAGTADASRACGPRKKTLDAHMGERLPLRILVAEDNAVNLRLVLLLLTRLGYRADVAGNGLEVLDALKSRDYDAILMDVQMPDMDGLAATRRIREDLPASRQPRIVALTANAFKEDREACLAAGMDDYLSKPVSVEGMVAALERCVANKAG